MHACFEGMSECVSPNAWSEVCLQACFRVWTGISQKKQAWVTPQNRLVIPEKQEKNRLNNANRQNNTQIILI